MTMDGATIKIGDDVFSFRNPREGRGKIVLLTPSGTRFQQQCGQAITHEVMAAAIAAMRVPESRPRIVDMVEAAGYLRRKNSNPDGIIKRWEKDAMGGKLTIAIESSIAAGIVVSTSYRGDADEEITILSMFSQALRRFEAVRWPAPLDATRGRVCAAIAAGEVFLRKLEENGDLAAA